MPTKYLAQYKDPMPFPDSSSAKTYKWYLAVARSCWHLYSTNRLGIGFGGTCLRTGMDIAIKRKYLFNQQSIIPILDEIDPADKKTGKRVINLKFVPVDYHTKTLNVGASRVQAFNYAVKTVAIDENSVEQKTIKVNKAKISAMPEIAPMMKEAGYQDKEGIGIEDPDDIDALAQMGSIGLKSEINLKNAVDHSLIDCNYKLTLQPMFIRDLITDNKMVSVVETNIETTRPHVKYIDIERCFFSPSLYPDHRDMTMGGYVEQVSIPTLRQYFTKEKLSGNTKYNDVEKVLQAICNTYSSESYNSYPSNYNGQYGLMSYYKENNCFPYDGFTITVATSYIIASDTQTYVHGLNETGEFQYKRIKNTDQVPQGMETDKVNLQNVYRTRWIVGTEFVYDCGIDNKIVRTGKKGNKKAVLPMVVFSSPYTSLMDRIIPKIDDINKCEFKERHLLNEMIPQPAFVVDMSLMEEFVTIGEQKYSPTDVISYFKKKGVMFIRSKNEFGESEGGSQRPPIDFLKDPSIDQIIKLAQRKAMLVQEMRDLVGINDIADGSQTSPELLVGVTQSANQSVNNALMPEILAYRQFMTTIGKMIMNKYEVALKEGEAIEGVYFDNNVRKEYKLSSELISETSEFAFNLEMSLSQEDKDRLGESMGQAYARGELSTSEHMTASMLLVNDDIQAARLFMAKAERKAKKELHEQQMQVTQGQAQAQGDAAVKAEEAKSTFTIAIDNNKHKNEMQANAMLHEYKLTEIDRQFTHQTDQADRQAENALLHESVKQTMIGEQKAEQQNTI